LRQFGRLRECGPSRIVGWVAESLLVGDQAAWNRASGRTGERGGARVGKPRWVRILTMTGGSSMAAIIFKALPQFGQRQSAQDFPRSWPTAVGGGRFRSGWQRPATGSLGPAPTGLRIRPAHRLVGRCPNEPPWLVAGLLVPWHVVLPGRALLAARCTQGHTPHGTAWDRGLLTLRRIDG
jgi:hypothetical protein